MVYNSGDMTLGTFALCKETLVFTRAALIPSMVIYLHALVTERHREVIFNWLPECDEGQRQTCSEGYGGRQDTLSWSGLVWKQQVLKFRIKTGWLGAT